MDGGADVDFMDGNALDRAFLDLHGMSFLELPLPEPPLP